MNLIDRWKILWGVGLIFLSFFFYVIHYLIFRDLHHIMIYFVGDIAFVFIQVLLVTMIIHELLNYRDKKTTLFKLNMLIGAFFSEVGTRLLRTFAGFDKNPERIRNDLISCAGWPLTRFARAGKDCKQYDYEIDPLKGDMQALRDFLASKRQFLINMLQNPALMEHDTFTDLLWAVFHLDEELENRTDIGALPKADLAHIANDIKRSYSLLTAEWLNYMVHLKEYYPHLFSLAARTNPFDPKASAEITSG